TRTRWTFPHSIFRPTLVFGCLLSTTPIVTLTIIGIGVRLKVETVDLYYLMESGVKILAARISSSPASGNLRSPAFRNLRACCSCCWGSLFWRFVAGYAE